MKGAIPSEYADMIPLHHGEEYVHHGVLKKTVADEGGAGEGVKVKQKEVALVLSTEGLYEFEGSPPSLAASLSLAEVHQIASILEQAMAIRLSLLSPQSHPPKAKVASLPILYSNIPPSFDSCLSFCQYEGWGTGDAASGYSRSLDYVAPSEQEMADWLLVGTHILNRFWQKYFEGLPLCDPKNQLVPKFFLVLLFSRPKDNRIHRNFSG